MNWLIRFKYLALAGFGLGLGLSLSALVYQTPMAGFATNSTSDERSDEILRIEPARLILNTNNFADLSTIDQLDAQSWYWSDRAAFWSGGSAIGQSGPLTIMVGLRSGLRAPLADLSLGDSLVIVGANGGEYRYGVVELRELTASQLGSVLEQSQPTLVVVVAQSWTGERVWVAIAR